MLKRKAKRISKKLGIHKPTNDPHSQEQTSDHESPVLAKVDSVSTQGSSEDSVITSSSTDNEQQPNNRPTLTHCKSAPSYDEANNLESLLSMEVQERLQAQKENEEHRQTPRPTRIRFALPQRPPRPRSPTNIVYPKARPVRSLNEEDMAINQSRHKTSRRRRSGWRLFKDDDDDMKPVQQELPICIGSRVRLKMRPLPTFGYVKYIGPVDFASGEYIGIELDFGVGDCDGSINGKRYFDSEGKRGVFLQRSEIEAVPEEEQE